MELGSPSPLRTSKFLDSPSPMFSKKSYLESSVAPDINEEFNPIRFLALHLKEFNEIRLE